MFVYELDRWKIVSLFVLHKMAVSGHV
jgi:hypothetical protein